ncbi:MAG: RadC family protein [Myxococcota bacterium]
MLSEFYISEEMPRERLLRYGEKNLSDTELLAIILRTGNRKCGNVLELSARLLRIFGGLNGIDMASISELSKTDGIGKVKAIEIKAALEIGKRLNTRKIDGSPLNNSQKVFDYLKGKFINETKEIFIAIILNNKLIPIKELSLTIGNSSYCPIDQTYIIKETIKEGFNNLIIAHNHPSMDAEPSLDDIEFTRKLNSACKLIGINLLDHIIIAGNSYYSFSEKKLLT